LCDLHDGLEGPTNHRVFSDDTDPVGDTQIQHQSRALFYPYSNKSSFLLGDWYWNNGTQKSQQSFKDLLEIVGSLDFDPNDVQHTKWSAIDTQLAHNDFHGASHVDEEDAEWINDDAVWKRIPIKISVLFNSRTEVPGPQEYHVGDLYHHSFVSVIHKKLTNPHDN